MPISALTVMYVRAGSNVAGHVLHCRQPLSLLSVELVGFTTRQASTSSKHPFPFPPCTNPTPHEIFHLPRNASQHEIKIRYYELVKVYHPDVTHGQLDVSPSVRNARFRAITHAYGILRFRHGPSSNRGVGAWDYCESRDEAMREELRRRSRRSGSASSSTTTAADSVRNGNADDTQLRYSLMAFVLAGMVAAMSSVSSHIDHVERHSKSAADNLAQARAGAQVYGMERRRQIREHVRAFHGERETVNGSEHSEMHDTSKEWQSDLSPGDSMERRFQENVSNNEQT